MVYTFDISHKIHSLKYQRFTTLGFKEMGMKKIEFVGKPQFLSNESTNFYFWTYLS